MKEDRDSLHRSKERRSQGDGDVDLCLAKSKERRECKSTDIECRAVKNLKGKRRMSFEVERWFAI